MNKYILLIILALGFTQLSFSQHLSANANGTVFTTGSEMYFEFIAPDYNSWYQMKATITNGVFRNSRNPNVSIGNNIDCQFQERTVNACCDNIIFNDIEGTAVLTIKIFKPVNSLNPIYSYTRTYTIKKPVTLAISGPVEIKNGSTATYTANYTGTSTNYQWSTTSGKLNIISGQGTKTITVSPNITEGTDQLKVTVGGMSATKNVTITSLTTNITNQTITSNKNFSNSIINISNTTITNNAIVNITAEESVTITPNFLAQQGTTVVIKAGSGLKSDAIVEDETILTSELPVSEQLYDMPLSVSKIDETGQPSLIKVYSITGMVVYSSSSNFDLKSANIKNGIYIIEKTDIDGNIKYEKVHLRN